jgi:hypothetical protein
VTTSFSIGAVEARGAIPEDDMSTLLITDLGELRDENCPQLRRALEARQPDFDLVAYVVRNLGFIACRRIARGMRIQMRPHVVSQVALTKLFQLLVEDRPERVGISFVDRPAMEQIVGDWSRALSVLDVSAGEAQDNLGELFLRRSRQLAELKPRDPLARLFGRWRARSGAVDLDDLPTVVGRSLRKRHVVLEPPSGSGPLRLRSFGGGFPTYGTAWHQRGNAMSVEHHPDYRYGKWVNKLYRDALDQREPMLDDIDALIARPQLGRERFRYRRLMLPIRGRDGTLRLLGASVFDADIDLRLKA